MSFGKNSQNARILSHLQQRGSITQLQALLEYDVMRLASRVSDLKKKGGVSVEKQMVTSPSGRRYARYFLPQTQVPEQPRVAA